ncbi:hypothetical protein C8T65DRAFT_750027 [Cerioporus squamosus]|nr:hypothetical protein C8T65DRAFT_750027 [Cerioporus squamosus]
MSVPPPPPSPPSQRPPVYLLNDQSGKLAAEDAPPPAIARVLAHRRSAPNLRPPCPPPATPPPPVPPPARSPPTAHRSPPRRARPDACTERAAGSVCASPSLPPPRGMTYPPLAHPLFTPPLWTQYLMETESDDTQPWPPPCTRCMILMRPCRSANKGRCCLACTREASTCSWIQIPSWRPTEERLDLEEVEGPVTPNVVQVCRNAEGREEQPAESFFEDEDSKGFCVCVII